MDRLLNAEKRVVGTKRVLRAIEQRQVVMAYVAADADLLLTNRVVDRCYDLNIPCKKVETMASLGKACKIDVGTAAAAILR